MISSEEYSPFLNWNPNDPFTVDSVAQAFLSLASMIRDGYPFDEVLVSQASQFVSSLSRNLHRTFTVNDMIKSIGQGTPNPTAAFVDLITILLSSFECLNWSSQSNRLALVFSSLVSRMLSTPNLRDLSLRENNVADTGTRRISGRNRTDTSSRSLIYERKASSGFNSNSRCPPLISSPVAPTKVNADWIDNHSSFHVQTADSWIIVIHTALLMGLASSSGCASPPVDEHEQLDQRLRDIHFCRTMADHTPAEPLTRYASTPFAIQRSHTEVGPSRFKQSPQFEETETMFDVVTSSLSLSNVEMLFDADFSIATLLESSHIKILSSTLDVGWDFTPFLADGGSVTLVDIVLIARPDPGTDGLVHADTHLTMSKCAAQDVIVGLSPIFGRFSSSVDASLSAFANLDHAVPLLSSPRPPALQPSLTPSLAKYSTILTSSTMVNVSNHIFDEVANTPIFGAEPNFDVKKTLLMSSKYVSNLGISELLITATADATLTISSCSFEQLHSSAISGFEATTPNTNHFVRLITKRHFFFKSTATHVTSATLKESSVEMDEVN
ncbi:hypothetical protein BLNAU_3159 [Blattamonas nauphoetae]|uniref:Uncharacterized protein n=1 Tax=Blattamonas nauphoetae TaxID=2049346 RepID=A0ABQ9YD76_9EUKA|nr:hypothetical protein BLNAU_3159 [Blattamonas nauphoetae]